MPIANVIFYLEEDGMIPVLDWLDTLVPKAKDKCVVRIERLKEQGHELRRPEADILRDGVYELRAKHAGMNYRLLYFFCGTKAVVLSHGFSKKQAKVPDKEIKAALIRKKKFEAKPKQHTYQE